MSLSQSLFYTREDNQSNIAWDNNVAQHFGELTDKIGKVSYY